MATTTFSFSTISGATADASADTVFEIPQANSSGTITFTSDTLSPGQFFLVRNSQNDLTSSKNLVMYSGTFQITDNSSTNSVELQAGTTGQIMMRTDGTGTRKFFFNPI